MVRGKHSYSSEVNHEVFLYCKAQLNLIVTWCYIAMILFIILGVAILILILSPGGCI